VRYWLLLGTLLLPVTAIAKAPDPPVAAPNRHTVDLRVQTDTERALQQMKGSVCGTGPFYAGSVADPVFVTPLLRTRCTITQTPRPLPTQR
jgi:hypothetical protein